MLTWPEVIALPTPSLTISVGQGQTQVHQLGGEQLACPVVDLLALICNEIIDWLLRLIFTSWKLIIREVIEHSWRTIRKKFGS